MCVAGQSLQDKPALNGAQTQCSEVFRKQTEAETHIYIKRQKTLNCAQIRRARVRMC